MIHRLTRSTIKPRIINNLKLIQSHPLNPNSTTDNMNNQANHQTHTQIQHRGDFRSILGSFLLAYRFHDTAKNKFGKTEQVFRTRLNCVGPEEKNKEGQVAQEVLQKQGNSLQKNFELDLILEITKQASQIAKIEDEQLLMKQCKELVSKKMKSPQFQEYLTNQLVTYGAENTLYIINNFCNKIKSIGIDMQNVRQYRVFQLICNQVFENFAPALSLLLATAEKVAKKVIAFEQQIKRQLAQQEKKQNILETKYDQAAQQQKNNLKPQLTVNTEVPTKKVASKTLNSIKVSIVDLSTILLNLAHIPKELHRPLFVIIFDRINHLSFFTLSAFMLDSVVNELDLGQDCLRTYHQKVNSFVFKNGYRYAYLCFIRYYMSRAYVPLFSLLEDGRRSYFYHQFSQRFETLYKYVKLMAFQYSVGMKCANRFLFEAYNRRVTELDHFLHGDYFSYFEIIKLYNVLAPVCSLGISLINNGILKDLTANETNIGEIKSFVLNFMKNLEPQYIYSIEEKVNNQINEQLLSRLYFLANEIMKIQPSFLIEATPLLQFSGKKGAYYRNYLFNNNAFVTNTVFDLIQQLQVHKNITSIIKDCSSQVRQKVLKIMNFLEKNHQFIQFKTVDFSKFLTQLSCEFLKIDRNQIASFSNVQWKLLFQTCFLLSKYEVDQDIDMASIKIFQLYKYFCESYIVKNQKNMEENMIRSPKLYEQYILRIASLVKTYFVGNPTKAQQVSNFINNNFIYTAKSIIKEAIFDIISLFENIPGINPQIYAYLYSNLSTFVIYIKSTQKFYLNSGKNFYNLKLFYELLVNALKNFETLKNVGNKNRLRTLKLFALFFWRKLQSRQIAQLLVILGNHSMITDQMGELLYKTKFTAEDISGLDHGILASFKLRNKSLATLLSKSQAAEQLDEESLVLNNNKTQQQLQNMFKAKQIYELAMETSTFTSEHLIPPPEGAEPRVKMIYACLKIAYKIRNERDFSVDGLRRYLQESEKENRLSRRDLRKKQIDLSEQIRYIKDNNLLKLNKLNEFKLGDTESSGHYEMVECWNYSDEFSNFSQIQGYSNTYTEIDPYEQLMLVLIGNYGLIRKLVKNQIFFSEVVRVSRDLKLEYTARGSLVAINQPTKKESEIYIFCSRAANLKLHSIYAYILSQMGYHVCLVEEKVTTEASIRALLTEAFRKEAKKPEQQPVVVQQTLS